ncbi:FHA domain-containing protein [Pseudomonas sp. GV071]|jgi:pSer/pThr/pTyr-binding forkhead associated (FHA) protein|uniref:FHA domain-containing protein n=1 Tax=Pseudomonas sp. GV071 TaxID=2135754 RepID=UPI000D37B2FF|nr:FHA domain-containing protein [Pseudomonas sp. GV071]PTQ70109.1 FHA domain-containing protein [Pseudomonas sp. GV071]
MLRIHFSDNRQAPIWLVDERFTIGQDSRNNLVLTDSDISPFHAEIRQDHGLYYLTDCGTAAGTFVNGDRVGARYQLRSEDKVRLGSLELTVIDPAKSKPKPAAAPRWFLQVITGEEHQGHKFHVTGSMTFGRSVKCEMCFGDLELSRRHAEFFLKDEVLEIKDLASANGVYVNHQKVGMAVLQPGDQVRMGSVTLLVIGPKVEVAQADAEDATLFMPVVNIAKPTVIKPVAQAATVNPLKVAADNAVQQEAAVEARPVNKVLLSVLALVLAIGGAFALKTLL